MESNLNLSCYVLKNRLNQINDCYVHFIQKVNFSKKKIVEISQGELWIKKPNLFHWHIISPEEFFLISDGKTIWFYVPLIKQVTAYSLKNNMFSNVFLTLLFNNNIENWKDYSVVQEKDWFHLKSIIHNHINMQECKINITEAGIIKQFSIIEENGKYIDYYLSNQNTELIEMDKFCFFVSEDMQLDDQRE